MTNQAHLTHHHKNIAPLKHWLKSTRPQTNECRLQGFMVASVMSSFWLRFIPCSTRKTNYTTWSRRMPSRPIRPVCICRVPHIAGFNWLGFGLIY